MALLPSTCPIAALSALIRVAAAADTVTVSVTWLSVIFTPTRARCPT